MAKKFYRIPDSLDKNFLDTEISLSAGAKPMKLGLILLYIGSLLLWGGIVTRSFVSQGGVVLITVFTVLWVIMTAILLMRDKTNVAKMTLLATMMDYIPHNRRYVYTRTNKKANAFAGIVGIKKLDDEKGLIEFYDGTFGYLYQVVGTASALLFDEDRNDILDRCDTFFRKIQPNVELNFITSKEPQKVYKQLATMRNRFEALEIIDEELDAVADMNFLYLKEEVGENFRSIHQYLLLKADNKEVLQIGKSVLKSEVENSSLMFKQCSLLTGDDIYQVLSGIYKGKESV